MSYKYVLDSECRYVLALLYIFQNMTAPYKAP